MNKEEILKCLDCTNEQLIEKSFEQIKLLFEEENNIYAKNVGISKCEDQCIGLIVINRSDRICRCTYWKENSLLVYEESNKREYRLINHNKFSEAECKNIVIVLESPHIHEYENGYPIGPACGKTGERIYQFLPNLINTFIPTKIDDNNKSIYDGSNDFAAGIYKIFLVNAIQYQCSLGSPTSDYRTDVFNKMWNSQFIKNDFVNRITELTPLYIINCCTKGGTKIKEENSIRSKVQDEINYIKKVKNLSFITLRADHPCCWSKDKLITIVNSNKDMNNA